MTKGDLEGRVGCLGPIAKEFYKTLLQEEGPRAAQNYLKKWERLNRQLAPIREALRKVQYLTAEDFNLRVYAH